MKCVSDSTGGATASSSPACLRPSDSASAAAHVGFVEHALHELREEHRHLAELPLDPAARKYRKTAPRDLPSLCCCLATTHLESSDAAFSPERRWLSQLVRAR